MYYRNADAAVLVYDITDSESFSSLQSWYQELQKNVPNCIIILAGNKLDLGTFFVTDIFTCAQVKTER